MLFQLVCPINSNFKRILLFQFILIFSLIDIQPVRYGSYLFPDWAILVGWCLSFTSVSAIPIVMILQILKERGPIIEVAD